MPERKLFLPGALQLTIQRLQPGAAADRDVLLRFASRRKFASKLFRVSIQGFNRSEAPRPVATMPGADIAFAIFQTIVPAPRQRGICTTEMRFPQVRPA